MNNLTNDAPHAVNTVDFSLWTTVVVMSSNTSTFEPRNTSRQSIPQVSAYARALSPLHWCSVFFGGGGSDKKKSHTCGSGSAQLEIKTTPPRGRAGHADAPVPPSLISRVIKCAGRVFYNADSRRRRLSCAGEAVTKSQQEAL